MSRQDWNYEYGDTIEPTIPFFYKPRNLTLLVLSILCIVGFGFYYEGTQEQNTKLGVLGAIVLMCLVGLLEFKDGPFIRPHPGIWRIILSLGICYEMALLFFLFQTKDDARQLFKFLDPSLGVRLPEKNYATNCDITLETLYDQMDVFVIAHSLGWLCKALIIRDTWLLWILSVLFEIMEYSLEHQLPNFAECWWDHWILDVFTANWLGIWLGMKLCDYFKFKQYSWRSVLSIPTVGGRIKRTVQQFTPHSWTPFAWEVKTFKGFLAVSALIVLELTTELNAFYLKYLLWIPVSSSLNLYRLLFMFLQCLPATREAYQFLSDPKCKRLGMHAWMTIVHSLILAHYRHRTCHLHQILKRRIP
ncbi:phosphatidylserine synthase 2-like protein [Gorgonomyces haynaldii]|nr:phosphatidylserine synthase 2-like protein [Gorgonomyces haynaldii]